jgi:uncharacterized protein (DUF1810 family)
VKPEFDASIFLAAQRHVWEVVVREIADGKKKAIGFGLSFPSYRRWGHLPIRKSTVLTVSPRRARTLKMLF